MRSIAFHADAFTHFTGWATEDPKLCQRIVRLTTEAAREPFARIGKPGPLRHELKGY